MRGIRDRMFHLRDRGGETHDSYMEVDWTGGLKVKKEMKRRANGYTVHGAWFVQITSVLKIRTVCVTRDLGSGWGY